jgi:hypothetical protein
MLASFIDSGEIKKYRSGMTSSSKMFVSGLIKQSIDSKVSEGDIHEQVTQPFL